MRRVSVIQIAVIVLVVAGLCLLVYHAPAFFIKDDKPRVAVDLPTGGTSVVAILWENRWHTAYRKKKDIEVGYESTGSTKGLKGLIDGKYAITFTHAPMSEEQRKTAKGKGGEVVHVPVILCAVVPVYNVKVKDGKPLKFTGDVLADIYLGKITKWNDPALTQLNQGAELPDTKMVVVHRKDSSGTTFIFADYLAGASEAWRREMGPPASELKWRVGEEQDRNHGVASYVQRTEGAIGYVDLLHAFSGQLPYGSVENKDKTDFIHAEAPNMTAALEEMMPTLPDDLTFTLTNRPGKKSYPICGAVWAVCYQKQPTSTQQKVVDFLQWVTHEGQSFATPMSYAPLPEALVKRVEEKLKSIKAAE
jgi:phosphate transport system substrate-binding protein